MVLNLTSSDREGVRVGTKTDGKAYSVRDDRSRYFFPDEWLTFYNGLRDKQKPIFDCLINTGARIDEALHIRPKDFDQERITLTLTVTKRKAAKRETAPKRRTFVISQGYLRRVNKHVNKQSLTEGDYLFSVTQQSVYQLLRNKLKQVGIKDWYNFSLHNIRKTHGNWLKALEVPAEEICLRLGHDFNTYLKHYGSATIFDRADKQRMRRILGEVYG